MRIFKHRTGCLLIWWGSFAERGSATIGDLHAVQNLSEALVAADVEHAVISNVASRSWRVPVFREIRKIERHVSTLVFVCGPLLETDGLRRILERFPRARKIAVAVSILPEQSRAVSERFDWILARDGLAHCSFDLAPARYRTRPPPAPPPASAPIGLCLRGLQTEYGPGRLSQHERIRQMFEQAATHWRRETTPIDTVLRQNKDPGFELDHRFGSTGAVATTRMHGALYALLNGRPPIAIDQIPGGAKVSSLLGAIEWPHVYPHDVSMPIVEAALGEALSGQLTSAAQHAREEIITRSEDALRRAVRVIARPRSMPVRGLADDRHASASNSQVFQAFWWGQELSPYEAFCLKSFVDHGHDVHLYAYDDILSVPAGVTLCDARAVFDKSRYFGYESGPAAGSPAGFSDLFRFKLLADKGGWWIDTDVVCLSGEIPRVDAFYAFESAKMVNGAVLRFPPRHPVMLQCLEEALNIGSRAKWGEIGPFLLTRVLRAGGLVDTVQPEATAYPIHWTDALDLFRPAKTASLASRIHSSLFLHLWNEILRRTDIDKTLLPPAGSLLRDIADQHPVAGWRGEYDIRQLELKFAVVQNELDKQRPERMRPRSWTARLWRTNDSKRPHRDR